MENDFYQFYMPIKPWEIYLSINWGGKIVFLLAVWKFGVT